MAKQDLILLALNPSPILDLMERALTAAGFGLGIVHNRSELDRALQETVPALFIVGEKFCGYGWIFHFSRNSWTFSHFTDHFICRQGYNGLAKSAAKVWVERLSLPST